MKLSILIPSTTERKLMLEKLKHDLDEQIFSLKAEGLVEIITFIDDKRLTIGEKRNSLLHYSTGEYVAFVDDDDKVSKNYVGLLLDAVKTNPDCCSLTGIITTNGQNPKTFIHSLEYNKWFEKNGVYYRPPNHLNCIRRSLALQAGFTEKNHGEDFDFSMKIQKLGLLKTEAKIEEVLYHYLYLNKK